MVGAIGDFIVPGNRVSEGINVLIKDGEKHQSDVVRADKEKFQIALKSLKQSVMIYQQLPITS